MVSAEGASVFGENVERKSCRNLYYRRRRRRPSWSYLNPKMRCPWCGGERERERRSAGSSRHVDLAERKGRRARDGGLWSCFTLAREPPYLVSSPINTSRSDEPEGDEPEGQVRLGEKDCEVGAEPPFFALSRTCARPLRLATSEVQRYRVVMRCVGKVERGEQRNESQLSASASATATRCLERKTHLLDLESVLLL